ncbi:bryoporin-like [Polypterus senegalus]|nr:bryoporin-like [Polypterus senegalus]XP_039621354.1 bryoporin-like [Polypterus senegalus]
MKKEMEDITLGMSLQGTSITQISRSIRTNRNIAIEFVNYSEKLFRNPRYYCLSGVNIIPPQPTIKAHTAEACSFGKWSFTARGSVGVMTYDIYENFENLTNKCLAIMFSVPFDYMYYDNWFGVGIFKNDEACDKNLFKKMYYGSEHGFRRKKASNGIIKYSSEGIEINAGMSNAAQSILKLEIWNKYFN